MHSRRQLTFLFFFALASPTVLPSPDVGAAKKKAAKGKAPAKKGGRARQGPQLRACSYATGRH